jgi:hypothetical protein
MIVSSDIAFEAYVLLSEDNQFFRFYFKRISNYRGFELTVSENVVSLAIYRCY